MSDSGFPEVRHSAPAEGHTSAHINKTVSTAPSVTKRSPSWDEDWVPARVAPTNLQSSTTTSTTQPAVSPNQPAQVNSRYSMSSDVASTQQLPSSCPAVDVEWPPRSSSTAVTTQFGGLENLNGNKSSSDSSLDDIDPFANWPPRPSGTGPSAPSSVNNGSTAPSVNKYGLSNSATTTNGLSSQSALWEFSTQNLNYSKSQNQGISSSTNFGSSIDGLSSQNSLGYLKPNIGISAPGSSNEKATSLGSIFATNKNEHVALRLAPPPTTAVGRVGGRGRGSRTGQTKPQPGQPPLMDLL